MSYSELTLRRARWEPRAYCPSWREVTECNAVRLGMWSTTTVFIRDLAKWNRFRNRLHFTFVVKNLHLRQPATWTMKTVNLTCQEDTHKSSNPWCHGNVTQARRSPFLEQENQLKCGGYYGNCRSCDCTNPLAFHLTCKRKRKYFIFLTHFHLNGFAYWDSFWNRDKRQLGKGPF